MSEEKCNGKCSSCESQGSCEKESLIEAGHELNTIKHIVGIVSGKGGVGKSFTAAMLAVEARRQGYKVGIMDADITGPSIPRMFGIKAKATGSDVGLMPIRTKNDIKIMSMNLLMDSEESPVIWRGPILANVVKQFWTDVVWDELDYLFIDMPPGTGDVPLTVFQSIPIEGIVVVTSPQDLVSMIVSKAVNMAKMMNIPVLGIVENMTSVACPDCGKIIRLFGESKTERVASEHGTKVIGESPLNPESTKLCDEGMVEKADTKYFQPIFESIKEQLQ